MSSRAKRSHRSNSRLFGAQTSDTMGREVTHFCSHPLDDNIVVVGGFNGILKLYDQRMLGEATTTQPLQESRRIVDGGLWRVVPKKIGGKGYFAMATCSENCFIVVDASDCRLSADASFDRALCGEQSRLLGIRYRLGNCSRRRRIVRLFLLRQTNILLPRSRRTVINRLHHTDEVL